MDTKTAQERSRNMASIRSKNTQPELKLRHALFALGLRYRLHLSSLTAKPDIVFTKRKEVIFVHGCFWNGHDNCPRNFTPKSRQDYWIPKIEHNKKRDAQECRELLSLSRRVLILCECALKKKGGGTKSLQNWFSLGLIQILSFLKFQVFAGTRN